MAYWAGAKGRASLISRVQCSMGDTGTEQLQASQEQEVKFQDIFVGFTRLKTQKMHVFLCSQILINQADPYCSHKMLQRQCYT